MKYFYIFTATILISFGLKSQDYTLKSNIGHTDVITDISISTDDKYLLSCSEDKTVILWDIKANRELKTYEGFNNSLKSISFNPDNTKFACGEGNSKQKNKIYIVDIKSKEILNTIDDNKGKITKLAFSKDGRYLLSGGPKELVLRDIEAGIKIRDFALPKEELISIDFSKDGKKIIASAGNNIYLWNINSREYVKTFEGHQNKISQIALTQDNKYIVSGSKDKTIKVWDIESGKELRTIENHGYMVSVLAVDRNNNIIASSDMGEKIKIWDFESTLLTNTLDGHKGKTGGIIFSNDNSKLISYGKWDRAIKIWDIKSGNLIRILQGIPKYIFDYASFDKNNAYAVGKDFNKVIFCDLANNTNIKIFKEKNGLVSCVDFFKKDFIAYGTTTNEVRIIKLNNKNKVVNCSGHSSWIKNIKISPDGKKIASTSHSQVIIWNANTGEKIMIFEKSPAVVYSLAFSNNNKYLATGEEKKITIWDISNGKIVKTLKGLKYPVYSLDFSSNGKMLVSGEGNDESRGEYKAVLWNLETGKKIRDIAIVNKRISAAIFTPDNKSVLLGSDKKIMKFAVNDNKKLLDFEAHDRWITSLNTTADNSKIISTSEDGTIKIWDNKTGELKLTEIAIRGTFDRIAFTPDGRFSGTEDGITGFYFVKNMQITNLEYLFEKFYTPQLPALVQEGILTGKSDLSLNNLAPAADISVVEPGNSAPSFRGALETRLSTDKKHTKVKVTATDKGGGIDEIRIYQNKKLVASKKLGIDSAGTKVNEEFGINLSKGVNEIEVATYNKERIKKSEVFGIEYTGDEFDPASLYVLAIGINEYKKPAYNLNYAVSDEKGFVEEIKNGSEKLFKDIKIIELNNDKANQANIIAALDSIKSEIKPDDVFLFYYAGHGSMAKAEKSEQSIFYLVPWEITNLYNYQMLQKKGISAEMLKEFSKDISAEKQLFILDACQSGGAVEYLASRGAEEEMAISQLAHSTGTYFISASGSKQLAGEFESLGHGVFTYVLLEGLKGKASAKDKKITVKELTFYLEDKVPEISQKYKGTAQYPVSFGFGQDFPLVLVK